MLRHPSRHYIYYLFSRRAFDVATIIAKLEDLRLPVPYQGSDGEESLKKFASALLSERERMEFPPNYSPLRLNDETRAFLKSWRIYDIWAGAEHVKRALDLLDEPQPRRMVEVLLLGPLSIPDIAYRVRRRFGLPEERMNTQVVRSYMHYFWDYGALTPVEWKELTFKGMTGFNHDYRLALDAPRTPAGAGLAIAAADRGGGASLSPVEMYTTIRDSGFRMFMEHVINGKPGDMFRTQGAMHALSIVTQAEVELDKHRGGSAELLEELNKIETVYDTERIRSAKELPSVRESLPSVIDVEGEVLEEEEAHDEPG